MGGDKVITVKASDEIQKILNLTTHEVDCMHPKSYLYHTTARTGKKGGEKKKIHRRVPVVWVTGGVCVCVCVCLLQ